jgi:hypothetical protein
VHQGRAHPLTLPFDVATVGGGHADDAGRLAVQSADGAVTPHRWHDGADNADDRPTPRS